MPLETDAPSTNGREGRNANTQSKTASGFPTDAPARLDEEPKPPVDRCMQNLLTVDDGMGPSTSDTGVLHLVQELRSRQIGAAKKVPVGRMNASGVGDAADSRLGVSIASSVNDFGQSAVGQNPAVEPVGGALRPRGSCIDSHGRNGRAALVSDTLALHPHRYGFHEQHFVGFVPPQVRSSVQSNTMDASLRPEVELEEGLRGRAMFAPNVHRDSDAVPNDPVNGHVLADAPHGLSELIWEYKGVPIRPVRDEMSSRRLAGDTAARRSTTDANGATKYTRQVGSERIPLRPPPAPAPRHQPAAQSPLSTMASSSPILFLVGAAADSDATVRKHEPSEALSRHNERHAELAVSRQALQLNAKSAKATGTHPCVIPGSCPILGRSSAGVLVSEPLHPPIRFKPQYKPPLPTKKARTIRVPGTGAASP